jgi:hypothetical protein
MTQSGHVVDSPKALDPERPIREADIDRRWPAKSGEGSHIRWSIFFAELKK